MKFYFPLFFLILFLLTIIVCCRHDADENPQEYKPEIHFLSGVEYVSNNTTLQKNAHFTVCINANSNTSSAKKLSHLKITKSVNNIAIVVSDSSINCSQFAYIYHFMANSSACNETWFFTVTDDAGMSDAINFTITTQSYPPTISYIFDNKPLQIGSDFMLAINASANTSTFKNLQHIVITRTFNNMITPVLDTSINQRNFSYFGTFPASIISGTEVWKFVAEDIGGESSFTTLNVYTIEALLNEKSGVIWNSMGTNNYAWDLLNDLPKYSYDTNENKDIINNTVSDEALPPYYFTNSWMAGNTTLFKRANWIDYENVTKELAISAIDGYTGGTVNTVPSQFANGLSADDIFVAKLRGMSEYVVIKITNVVWTTDDHLDKIEFVYKK